MPTLNDIVDALNNGVPYMLTGSYASSLHSGPRAIDIVIFPDRDQLTRFIRSLPPDRYHADLEDAMDALSDGRNSTSSTMRRVEIAHDRLVAWPLTRSGA